MMHAEIDVARAIIENPAVAGTVLQAIEDARVKLLPPAEGEAKT